MELVYYPDPRLRQVSKPIEKTEIANLKDIVKEMFKIMYESRGIGLAGPQVGYGYRIIVANLLGKQEGEEVFINPEIVEKIGEVREEEGCLSLPGIVAQVLRAEQVIVDIIDLDGGRRRVEADGLYARLFQHEIDHLDGILLIDKMTPAEKKPYSHIIFELEDDFKRGKKRKYDVKESVGL